MELIEAANALKELGHPTRLGIYRELVKAGHAGLPVGDIQKTALNPIINIKPSYCSLTFSGFNQARKTRTDTVLSALLRKA